MIEIIDNVFDSWFNQQLTKKLQSQRAWQICNDNSVKHIDAKDFDNKNFSDTGMVIRSFSFDQDGYWNKHSNNLNFFADIIFDKIMDMSKNDYSSRKLYRYLWNYYNRASTGVDHKDVYDEPGKFCSIIYYVNDNDGYTEIGNNKIQSISGRAVLFDSDIIHKGIGPCEYSQRFCLNILFKYDDRRTK